MTDADIIKRLRYMGRQYSAGQSARGGGGAPHYLDEAADLIERQEARIRELEKDAGRLDWCQAQHFAPRATLVTAAGDVSPKVWLTRNGAITNDIRAAIDAAMESK